MKFVWGLAASGSISRSFISRFPALSRHLGPVTSTSYRLAVRIANTLRAGNAVREFAELKAADVVLFCMPGGSLDSLIQVDALNWKSKVVITCESMHSPLIDADLRRRGAALSSINQITDLPDSYVIVGDRPAVRIAKSIVHALHGRAIEVRQDRLLLFQSALTFSGSLFTPLIETTLECLRQAGVAQSDAAKLADSLFQHSLRTFKHAGRKSWTGPIARADEYALAAQEDALRSLNPLMASYFHDNARYGFELYQTFPELTRYNKERWKEHRKRNRAIYDP